jgi:YegS/Rv2252/BmrU family lipid kinase
VRRTTAAAGDAERLAREAEAEFDTIVAAGGDGTINAVVNGMRGSRRPLAIVPLGTANVFANAIGLPLRAAPLAAAIADGEARPVWPGEVDGRLFLSMAGSGFDADVVAAVNRRLKRHTGRIAFLWAILTRLWHYRMREITAEIDGVAHRAASVIFTRSRFYAGRFVLVPAAQLDDPTLHIVLFRRPGRIAALRAMSALALGFVHRLPDVSIIRGRRVLLAGDRAVAVHVDGEICGRLPVSVAVAAEPIYLIRPAESAGGEGWPGNLRNRGAGRRAAIRSALWICRRYL